MITEEIKLAKSKLKILLGYKPGIEGVGSDGVKLRVYVSDEAAKALVPPTVDGIPVEIINSGKIEAQPFSVPIEDRIYR